MGPFLAWVESLDNGKGCRSLGLLLVCKKIIDCHGPAADKNNDSGLPQGQYFLRKVFLQTRKCRVNSIQSFCLDTFVVSQCQDHKVGLSDGVQSSWDTIGLITVNLNSHGGWDTASLICSRKPFCNGRNASISAIEAMTARCVVRKQAIAWNGVRPYHGNFDTLFDWQSPIILQKHQAL